MHGQAAHAPEVMDAELLHALRRKLGRGELSEAHADRLVTLIQRAPIERVSHEPLVRIAWRLRNNVSAYDALYVALAQRLSAPLVTADARLAGAPGLGVPVTLVPSR
jgi:predicted nucleic acid-binding protein